MNLFQLILKQMRQRALGTTLTLLSVFCGVALAVGIFVLRRGGESLFVQREFGYDLIIGSSKGSPLQLVLNTVYNLDQSPGNFPYLAYEAMTYRPPPLKTKEEMAAMPEAERTEWDRGRAYDSRRFPYWRYVRLAVPFARGDTYRNRPILATSPEMFGMRFDEATGQLVAIPPTVTDDRTKEQRMSDGIFQYRPGERFEFAEGTVFHPRKFQAVIGAEVAERTGLKLGQTFEASHGASHEEGHGAHDHAHDEQWRVVGVLKKTGTAFDRTIYIPLITFYCIPDHDKGIRSQADARLGVRTGEGGGGGVASKDEPKPYEIGPDGIIRAKRPQVMEFDDPGKSDEQKRAEAAARERKAEDAWKAKWQLSGVFVQTSKNAPLHAKNLLDHVNNGGTGVETRAALDTAARVAATAVTTQPGTRPAEGSVDPDVLAADVTAVRPGDEMRMLFNTFMKPSSEVLLLIAFLVSVLAAVGILVSIYNSVAARTKEIAILRARGATRGRVLMLICLEAAMIGLAGAAIGWAAGHLIGAAAAREMERRVGQGFDWTKVGVEEVVYVVAVVAIAALAGLVPALKAYRTPVATNLVAS